MKTWIILLSLATVSLGLQVVLPSVANVGQTIQIQVLDDAGTPVATAPIYVFLPDSGSKALIADGNGTANFTIDSAGAYSFTADGKQYFPLSVDGVNSTGNVTDSQGVESNNDFSILPSVTTSEIEVLVLIVLLILVFLGFWMAFKEHRLRVKEKELQIQLLERKKYEEV